MVDITAVGAENRPLLQAIGDSWRDAVSGNPEGTPDPSPGGAELMSISPSGAVHGGADLQFTAAGHDFVKGFHEIVFNGKTQATTFVDAATLRTTVKPSQVASAGTATVRVSGAEGQKTFTFT